MKRTETTAKTFI